MTPDGREVMEYTLTNCHGLEMKVIDYGCTITSLKIPDRNGVFEDIVLGFDDLNGYLQSVAYIGCIVGRYANRIAHGKFTLDGKEYRLAANQPPHHLHGGIKGFSHAVWKGEEILKEDGVGLQFTHLSPDGDEGYPGNVNLAVNYILGHDNSLSFEYHATTDKTTIINLTQHSYFNLNGGGENILEHELTIPADQFLPTDTQMIPTGEIKDVVGTPFDFRKPKKVGRDIGLKDDQLEIGHGYDHTFIIGPSTDDLHHAATLFDPGSGER